MNADELYVKSDHPRRVNGNRRRWYSVVFRCNADGADAVDATIYGSTAQECRTKAVRYMAACVNWQQG